MITNENLIHQWLLNHKDDMLDAMASNETTIVAMDYADLLIKDFGDINLTNRMKRHLSFYIKSLLLTWWTEEQENNGTNS